MAQSLQLSMAWYAALSTLPPTLRAAVATWLAASKTLHSADLPLLALGPARNKGMAQAWVTSKPFDPAALASLE